MDHKEYTDETRVCKECGNEFVFTAGEQEFYDKQGFKNKPERCKNCRDARKSARNEHRSSYNDNNSNY